MQGLNDTKNSRKGIFGGFFWKFLERFSTQLVTFVLSIILARILDVSDYGQIAMINVFIGISNIFLTSGLNTALIQKKDADDVDFSTIFICNSFLSVFLYLLIYISAPYIASFYNMPDLCALTRVYGCTLLLYSLYSVQQAYMARNMLFRKLFISTIFSSIISGVLGIIMAYNGFGVWALVTQYLSHTFIGIITLGAMIDWHPKFQFSKKSAKALTIYGSRVLAASFIGEVCLELRQLIIGKYYSASDLALYNRGKTFPTLISSNIEATIGSVLFPAMSNYSGNASMIKQMTRRSMKTSSYIMFFLFTCLAIVAHPLIEILLTKKWVECVPYLQIMCLAGMISIVSTANMQAIKAIGRSDVLLKLELYKKPVFIILLLIGMKISVLAIAITLPIYSIYAAIVNMIPNKRLLNYTIKEQIIDLLPQILLAIVMFLIILPISLLRLNLYITILIQLIGCIVIYYLGSKLLKLDSFNYCKMHLSELLHKR